MATVERDNGSKVPAEGGGEENVGFESDSDEGTSALALRRRVASDDEEDDEETNTAQRDDYYDQDLEHHEGGPPLEEDEDEEDEEEEEEEYEDAEDEGIAGRKEIEDYDEEEGCEVGSNHAGENLRKPQGSIPIDGNNEVASEEKKDAEPFVVPTAGAFYMHDDRFRYNGLARPRRSAGGRKLWEAKDEKPWVHDRFEELKLQEEGYSGQGVRGRRGRGRQGRVQGRNKDGGHARGKGIRERNLDDSLRSLNRGPGRGRGLRRAKMDDYEFRESRVMSSRGIPHSSDETTSSTSKQSSRQNLAPSQPITKPQDQDSTSKKPTISSMLKVSSPPFFPTGAVLQSLSGAATGTSKVPEENSGLQRDVPPVGRLTSTSRSGMERDMARLTPASAMRLPSGPEISTGLASASINGDGETGLHRNLARGSSTLPQQVSRTGSGAMTQQHRVTRAEVSTLMADQSLHSQSSTRGAPSPAQPLRVQLVPAPSQQTGKAAPLAAQPMRMQQPLQSHQQMQAINQQTQISSGQSMQSQSLVSPVSFPASKPAIDVKSAPSPLGSNLGSGPIGRSTQAVTMQAGRGTVVYGSSSLTNGLRGVVQIAGQPQAGLGVPTVGMALPGYGSQPQFGFPNSEVTWIPILAGGGSLSSNYNPPYIAVDEGSSAMYYTQQGSQPSNFPASLGDINKSKVVTSNPLKTPPRTEPDDLGQQRRRYSQMTFGEERR